MSRAPDDAFDAELDENFKIITLGSEMLDFIEAFPEEETAKFIRAWLSASLTDPHERRLFDFPPLPAGQVVPLSVRRARSNDN